MSNKTFAEIFTRAIEEYAASLGQISTRLYAYGHGVNKSTLKRWRDGTSYPSLKTVETLRLLPKAFGMSPAQSNEFLFAISQALGFDISSKGRPSPSGPPIQQRIHLGNDALPPFVGRRDELANLQQKIHNRVSVVITGLGGVGKTRLAQELLRLTVNDFSHGSEYLRIGMGESGLQVIRHIAHLLGISIHTDLAKRQSRSQILEQIRSQTQDTNLLFLVDNVELPEQVRDLVRSLPAITWIFTARDIRLKSLGVYTCHLSPPATQDAAQIFQVFAQNLSFSSREETTRLHEIVEKLGRLPLALRLAACLLENGIVQDLDELSLWLNQRNLFNARSFFNKLRILCDGMLDSLPGSARQLFEVLGVFATPKIQISHAQAIHQRLGGCGSPETWSALSNLSLITHPDEKQVELHPLLHEYARLRLKNSATFPHVREQFKAHYLELCAKIADSVNEADRNYWQLTPDEANLLSVAQQLYQQTDWQGLKQLYPTWTGYLWTTGNFPEYANFEQKCLHAAQNTGNLTWEGKICSELGFLKMEQLEWDEAHALFQRAQAIHDQTADNYIEQARLRRYRALLAIAQNQLPAAAELLQQVEERLSHLTNPPESRLDLSLLWLHSAKMQVFFKQGQLEEAEEQGLIARQIHQKINQDGGLRSYGYKSVLGDVLIARGKIQAAIDLWEDMLARQQGLPLMPEHAEAQIRLAWVYASLEEKQRALELAASAIQLFSKYGETNKLQKAELLLDCIQNEQALPHYLTLFAA